MSSVSVRPAVESDFEPVHDMYLQVLDEQEYAPYHPCWRKGVYPDASYLRACISSGQMWVAELEQSIAGAMVINQSCNEGYLKAQWSLCLKPGEFCVLHTLAVSPSFRRRGVADAMVSYAIELTRSLGMKALRVDLIDLNKPIEPLYLRHGFVRCGAVSMYHEAVDWQLFHLYEHALR